MKYQYYVGPKQELRLEESINDINDIIVSVSAEVFVSVSVSNFEYSHILLK